MVLSTEDVVQHDQLVRNAAFLARRDIAVAERPNHPLDDWGRLKLLFAAKLYRQALHIHPTNWAAMWSLGKVYQRLGDHIEAYEWLHHARHINPRNADVAREASNEALRLGHYDVAVNLAKAAAELAPTDPGLICNLAVAYMLAGDNVNAIANIEEAVSCMPGDPVTAAAAQAILDVAFGRRPKPTTILELEEIFPQEPSAPQPQ